MTRARGAAAPAHDAPLRIRPPVDRTSTACEVGHCSARARHDGHETLPTYDGPPPGIRAGTVVGGRYEVVRPLGEGSMGQVFEARHVGLGRRFALKVIRRHPCSEEAARRFSREARSLARVASPWVAQVSDFGREPGLGLFYVMEFVSGETLEERLHRAARIDVTEVVPIGLNLCAALSDVHAAGVLHRDVKPANVALPAGPIGLKLLDFGLAVDFANSVAERLTTSRSLVGSLAYVAPEIIVEDMLSTKADLYSLGVLLFECVTGRLPFEATSVGDMIQSILHEPVPPVASVAPGLDVPPAFEAVVARLLDKNPEERFSSAAATARALAASLPH